MTTPVLLPGATLGVLGGGQLGRMFAQAAQRLGYKVVVWSDAATAPALALADVAITAPYTDEDALECFAAEVEAVTVEFENLPATLLEALARRRRLRPSATVVRTFQHRGREKRALADLGLPLAPYRLLPRMPDREAAGVVLGAALGQVGLPALLKTAGFGYDGKGQVRLDVVEPLSEVAFALMSEQETVLEAYVALALELSVVVARGADGAVAVFPVFENHHRDHILDLTLVPARVSDRVAARATELALELVRGLEVVGLVCVELFLTEAGELWVNEVAPRPHNSGHISIEACSVDQFEQQVRALAGLPLGCPERVQPGAMVNLLGDLWFVDGAERTPDWRAALALPGVRLHLYGKAEARRGRKMGHLSALAASAEEAAALVLAARAAAVGTPVPMVPAFAAV